MKKWQVKTLQGDKYDADFDELEAYRFDFISEYEAKMIKQGRWKNDKRRVV